MVLVPSLHGYALCDRVIRKFAGNFGMAGYNKLILAMIICLCTHVVHFECISKQ
jgi:hypothetical protein